MPETDKTVDTDIITNSSTEIVSKGEDTEGILNEENYEGYIAIRENKIIQYDFSKVYTDEKMDKIYVNLSEILELIEVDTVVYNKETELVSGYIPNQLILGSNLDKKISWKVNEKSIIKDDNLYVEYQELQNIFPIEKINWSKSELFLDINYGFMLPIELKLLRDDKRKQNLYKGEKELEKDVIEVERKIMTPGMLSLYFDWNDFSEDEKNLTYQYNSIFLYGELSLGGKIYEDLSLDFYRQDYDNFLENKIISLGKTTLFNTPRIFKGNSSITGISINRKNINFSTTNDQGNEIIEGFAPINSVVELYQNNFLINFKTIDNTGFFRFSKIQSKSFSDSYIIKIYDGKGFLIEERKYNSMYKNDFLKKGEIDYQFALGEGNDYEGLVSGADFYWGIFDRVTYNPGFYYSEKKKNDIKKENFNTKTGKKILKNSLLYRSKMTSYPYYTKFNIYTDVENFNNGYDWEYKQQLFFDLQMDLYYNKTENGIDDLTNYSDKYKASLKRSFKDTYLRLEYEKIKFFKEEMEENYRGEVTYNINQKTLLTLTEEYKVIDSNHLTKASLNYIFDEATNVQLEIGKNWGDDSDSDLEFAIISFNRSPNRSKSQYSFQSGIKYNKKNDDVDWSGFISIEYYFGRGGTFCGKYRDTTNERFGINYDATVNLARPFENQPPGETNSSWVEGNIFLDANSNGKFDKGEIPLEDIEVISGRNHALSDKKGYYYLAGISPKNVNKINYSHKNLSPNLTSLNTNNKVIIPPTDGYYCAIPLAIVSGVTGFVEFDSTLKIKASSRRMIFARMKIQVLEGNQIVKEVPVEAEGFYILDGLKPGDYKVRCVYFGVKEITFEKDEISLQINPEKYGDFYEEINLKVKNYE